MHKAGTKSSTEGRGVMKKRAVIWILILVVFIPPGSSAAMDKAAVIGRVSGLQMPFIENRGQIGDDSVRFYAKTFAGTVYVTERGEIVYSIVKTKPAAKNSIYGHIASGRRIKSSTSRAVALRERPVGFEKTGTEGGTVSPYPLGIHRSAARVNYFIGGKENWRTGIPTWREVSLGEVYNGIELRLRAYGKNVEKVFTVQPEGSVGDIRLEVEGAEGLAVNREGELEIATALGIVKMTKPVAYQEIDGRRVEVAASYTISGRDRELVYGFQVGEYDDTKPLVIDPLLASTFLGGSRSDIAISVAVDGSGYIYVSGGTLSTDFPTTMGAYNTIFLYREAFVSKFDNDLDELLASTFVGPAFSCSMTIDAKGYIYLTGITSSPDFPTTPGAYDRYFGSYDPDPMVPYEYFYDGFISILDGSLENLIASTYVGLSTDDDFFGNIDIAVDKEGNVYMTSSTLCGYVGTGIYCAVVAKFDAGLENQLASIVLPRDSGSDAISIDSNGNVYVVGTGNHIPTTPDAYDTTPPDRYDYDAFIAKFDDNLEGVLAATYLGGDYMEWPRTILTDEIGNVYVTGWTRSTDFPTTTDAYDTDLDGDSDAFISKFDADLENLLASTFLGGDGFDGASHLMIGGDGNLYVTGWTSSTDFPTTPDAYDTTLNGAFDVFISRLNNDLKTLLSSTYLGGTDGDSANSLTIDANGYVYVTGRTRSSDFPVTPEAFDPDYNGGERGDAFISKLGFGSKTTRPHRRKCRH